MKALFDYKFNLFFINSGSNLTQPQILTVKPTLNLTLIQTLILPFKKCADVYLPSYLGQPARR